MNLTERDEAIASWLAQVGHAIAKRCCEAQIARRYGCRYLPDLEISEGSVIARCCNSLVASTIWQLRQPLIELGDELLVYWGWHHDRLYLQGVRCDRYVAQFKSKQSEVCTRIMYKFGGAIGILTTQGCSGNHSSILRS
jgi:hypothetical protein